MEDMNNRIDELLSQLTLEEKAALTVGRDFWTTNPIDRLGIPSIWLADGPGGLRKSVSREASGIGDSLPATCFPTASALASTWNRDLIREVGEAIGTEAQAADVQVILGPGINQKRSALGGRNFEYLSEDPILSGELATAFIEGVQSQGVGACPKHYVANESETGRMYTDAIIDERTLRENYLRPFEIAIAKARPWTIMESYNRINGEFVSENRYLLHDVLKEEWGFDGIVMSDWHATNNRIASLKAGMHLQMPHGASEQQIVDAVHAGELDESQLDTLVRELLHLILKADAARKTGVVVNADAHHSLARRAAGEAITLLQNDDDLLPLPMDARVAVIGEFARTPRIQGGGSSLVNPTRVESIYAELSAAYQVDLPFAPGYEGDTTNDALIAEAVTIAKEADVAVVVIGLPDDWENEGVDRTSIDLPDAHNTLVSHIHEVQPNTVVVLINGAAVDLTWVSYVPAIVEGWLGGQAGGGAIAEVLTGAVNPSGKLAETFPMRLEDTPTCTSFWPDAYDRIQFSEGVFTGYRWYDTRDLEPMFPFGHGLSYTTFDYSDLRLSADHVSEDDPLTVSLTVTNTGERAGQETVQLYLHEIESRFPRAVRELKDFAKIPLEPGESRNAEFVLRGRDFAQWDDDAHRWIVNSGEFTIYVGSSSRDLRLSVMVQVTSTSMPPRIFTSMTPLGQLLHDADVKAAISPLLPGRFIGHDDSEGIAGFVEQLPVGKLVMMGEIDEEQLAQILRLANQYA